MFEFRQRIECGNESHGDEPYDRKQQIHQDKTNPSNSVALEKKGVLSSMGIVGVQCDSFF